MEQDRPIVRHPIEVDSARQTPLGQRLVVEAGPDQGPARGKLGGGLLHQPEKLVEVGGATNGETAQGGGVGHRVEVGIAQTGNDHRPRVPILG